MVCGPRQRANGEYRPPATTPSGQNLPAAANGAGDQSSHASAASQAVLNCTSAGQQGPALAACIIDGLGLSAQAVLGSVDDDMRSHSAAMRPLRSFGASTLFAFFLAVLAFRLGESHFSADHGR